jgi:integrase
MAAAPQLGEALRELGTACKLPGQAQRFDGQKGISLARRRYQKGRVFLRGKKTQKWIGRWREDIVGEDGIVRRVRHSVVLGEKSKSFTKPLAERKLGLILGYINAPEYRPGRIASVEEFAEKWKTEVLAQRKPTTKRSAEAHLRCHILPQFKTLRLDELSREQQQVFVTRLSQKVSRKSVENIMGTLSSLLTTARKWGYITDSVKMADLVLPDAGVKTEARFFTSDQVRDIIALAQEPFKTMFCILALTGIRAGELLGLKDEDLDFDRRLIFIRRSMNRGLVQSVKSKASRKPLPMPEALEKTLKRFLENRQGNHDGWLFLNNRKRPFSGDKVVMLKLWPILDQLKIPRCGLHAFRHFHSTMLLELGAAPQVAQARMRHSDPRITLEVYSHVVPESQRKAVEKVAEILDPIGPKSDNPGEWIQ